MDNQVKVGVRIRPMVPSEIENGATNVVSTDKRDQQTISIDVPARKNTFEFDWVFPASAHQSQVYESLCQPLIVKIFEGLNATVFAYGQTGSGKTHTMGNAASSLQGDGIIILAMQDIFKKKSEIEQAGGTVDICLSYIEVYMEEIFDLLTPPSQAGDRNKLDIRETSKGETILEGLTMKPVGNIVEVGKYLADAAQYRSVSGTAMNASSSRSHAICTLSLRIVLPDQEGSVLLSKLHMVDLAGSERAKKTMATGDVFTEGVSINKSLLALGNVVAKLAEQSSFIPYRESKLTRLLKDALGGNGLTVMLACVSPANLNADETINTLRFASRASSIVNSVKINHDDSSRDNETLKKDIISLRQQIETLQLKCQLLSHGLQQQQQQQQQSVQPLTSFSSSAVSGAELAVQQTNQEIAMQQQNLVNAMYILTASFKNILVSCLEEGVPLDEDTLEEIKEHISNVYKDLKQSGLFAANDATTQPRLSDVSVDSNANNTSTSLLDFSLSSESLDFLPPIVVLIDKLSTLMTALHKVQNGSTSTSASSSASAIITGSSADPLLLQHQQDESSLQVQAAVENEMEQGLNIKKIEINKMIDLTEKFEVTIAQLKDEINSLEKDKARLAGRFANNSSNSSSLVTGGVKAGDDLRSAEIRKELHMKSRILEEKVKELRLKEGEYGRVMQQKERLSKEADVLHRELDESKKKRTELMRKMKEDGTHHLAERQKLQHAEIQSRRREQQAYANLLGMKTEFDMKEKVLKGQLAARERESKQLRDMVDKQAKVRAYREGIKSALTAGGGGGHVQSASTLGGRGMTTTSAAAPATMKPHIDLPLPRVNELKTWIVKETEAQTFRYNTHDEIARETELRGKAARQLQLLRSGQQSTSDPAESSTGSTSNSMEAKLLEEEVRRRSVVIAQKQKRVADLGPAVLEKKRFAPVTDLKEAKFVMEWMFDKITKDNAMHRKTLESKVANQRNQIENLKKQLFQAHAAAPPASATSSAAIVATENNTSSGTKRKAGDLNDSFSLMNAIAGIKAQVMKGRKSLTFNPSKKSTSSSSTTVAASAAAAAAHVAATISLESQQQQLLKDNFAHAFIDGVNPSIEQSSSSKRAKQEQSLDDSTSSFSFLSAAQDEHYQQEEPLELDEIPVQLDESSVNFDIDIDEDEVLADDEEEEEDNFDLTLDETFYPDDEDDEDYNPEEEEGRLAVAGKRKATSQQQQHRLAANSSLESTSSESMNSSSNTSQEEKKKKESVSIVMKKKLPLALATRVDNGSNVMEVRQSVEGPTADKPLSKCTVKELKSMLAGYGLITSGLKEDLMNRLLDHYNNIVDKHHSSGFGGDHHPSNDIENQTSIPNAIKKKRFLGTATIMLDSEESFTL